ncbi:MAG: long-chain fatty acid--CoA ligase [Methylococcales bacterium]|jgi:long-chain acyl-CoA synthetase|nr:long-chain fatty acid--CoA ligase [Methylococcales bacterium]MBT7443039.1 long-chain fatty acid--CoA ligase [Methylococcales bacterium]
MDIELISLPEKFSASVARHAEQIAMRMEGQQWSFRHFGEQSNRVASGLKALGVSKGDRVALYCINSEAFVVAYFGILKAGATVVPINLLLTPREITYILKDADVNLMIFHALFEEKVNVVRGDVEGLRQTISIGEAESGVSWQTLLETQASNIAMSWNPKDDVAVIIYTSGTTGYPKGAMLTHYNLVANTTCVMPALKLQPGKDVILLVLPMFHAFAATVGMLTPLLNGLTIAPLAKFEPNLVAQTIEAEGVTVFLGVPSMYNVLLKLPEEATRKIKRLRYCVSGGAAMPVEMMNRFEARFGVPIHEGDGPTECSPVTSVNPIDAERKAGSIGLPIPNVEMKIVDDNGAEVEHGVIGEICVRGPNVMKGYLNQPEQTAESFFGDWFRTGDLGSEDDDGYFFIVDRKKDMIIVNGMNVYPRVVEEVLYMHPSISEAAVIGEPSESHGEIPIAYVALKDGYEGTASKEIRAFCRENLGAHQVPKKVHFMADLPKNAAGKIVKRALRKDGEIERGIV